MTLLLCTCPFHRHRVKLLFTTPNNLELPDVLSGQFRYRLRIGRRGRLCSSVSSPFGGWVGSLGLDRRNVKVTFPPGGGGLQVGGGVTRRGQRHTRAKHQFVCGHFSHHLIIVCTKSPPPTSPPYLPPPTPPPPQPPPLPPPPPPPPYLPPLPSARFARRRGRPPHPP